MTVELRINLLELVMCVSDAVDLVDEAVVNHHKQVAFIAYSIGHELGLSKEEQSELLLAGALHDIGALSLKERLEALRFEVSQPHEHALRGNHLLRIFQPFSGIAKIIRMHHVHWNNGAGIEFAGNDVPLSSHILHLADRVAVSIKMDTEVLSQAGSICRAIKERSGTMFNPEAVDAFLEVARKESFWFDAASKSIGAVLTRRATLPTLPLTLDDLLEYAELFSHIIDFRSRFTATHSSGIAASAEAIARLAGYSPNDCKMMRIAGCLHDLGKLAVPADILNKPAALTKDEFRVVQKHPYHTHHILEAIEELHTINTWGAYHHERVDGNGYPFHVKGKDLPEGSRIMAVADVFTAVTEDRPYRCGMDEEQALRVLQKLAMESALDSAIVLLLKDHFDEVNRIRIGAQEAAMKKYQAFDGTIDGAA